MSQSKSTSDHPPTDREGESVDRVPQKRKFGFSFPIKFRGFFASSKPDIIGTPSVTPQSGPDARSGISSSSATTAKGSYSTGERMRNPADSYHDAAADTRVKTESRETLTPGRWLSSLFRKTVPVWLVLLLGVLAVIVIWLALPLLGQGTPQIPHETEKLAVPTAEVLEYTDDLHAFHVSYATGEAWEAEPIAAQGCIGSIFASDVEGLKAQDPKYPRLRVCFLGFALDQPGKSLNQYLDERLAWPTGLQVLSWDRGMIKDVEIGTDKTSGRGAFLIGTEAESNRPTKWYIAIVNFEGRIYSIEAVATQQEWDALWPKFTRLIERIQFGSGVIRPLP